MTFADLPGFLGLVFITLKLLDKQTLLTGNVLSSGYLTSQILSIQMLHVKVPL